MELNTYRNFLAIVEIGSITGAAEYVHIAQPALSKQIKMLENHFGAKLIMTTRGSRQLLLTEAGRILYQRAKYICSLEDLAKHEIDNVIGGVVGTLSFSIANSRSAFFIKTSLKAFCQLNPQITIELYEASLAEQTQQLLNGITEIGIFSTPVYNQENFEVLFRRDEHIVAVFHKDSIWIDNAEEHITLSQLKNIPISVSEGCYKFFKEGCTNVDIVPRIVCISTTRNTALHWATENTAVAIVPLEPSEDLGDNYIIKRIIDLKADVYKSIVKVKGRPLSVASQKFLKFYAKTRNSQQVCNLDEILKNSVL